MEAGYYPTQPDGTHKPWCFDMIRKKCKKLIFVSSKTDPFIPIEEPRLLARELGLKQLEIVGKKPHALKRFDQFVLNTR